MIFIEHLLITRAFNDDLEVEELVDDVLPEPADAGELEFSGDGFGCGIENDAFVNISVLLVEPMLDGGVRVDTRNTWGTLTPSGAIVEEE